MRIECDDRQVTVHAPAKLNLMLEVVARRNDGYHEIETVMAAIDVCDRLTLSTRDDERIEFSTRWLIPDQRLAQQLGDVPAGASNLVVRAIERLRERAGVRLGANVHLAKRIASAAGLGGASSDAAAALLAANRLWQLDWSRRQLADLAAELGSDVPFFLGAPVAICRGRGELIEPLESLPALDVVVVRPPEGLSTPQVFKHCRPPKSPVPAQPLVNAWRAGDRATVGRLMTNRLQAPAEALSPWIGKLASAFDGQGCYGHQMSGSGSSYFGICRNALHARQVGRRLNAGGLGFVYVTRTIALWESKDEVRAA